ncbi:hypothetical protein P153DRAFT_430952 [Dothidotthia symphoricarpi CBS 119687]|uniref:USP8 dimerisation domain-containing protein n=1 Tax=Dothidotthia symphoricarpi CBS 119687 TaxID=1392245 RepID=A0A6A6AFZ0_9PLEO|nr:uncharacterized protein P153DRAFT_430952 [Dothidotthia symphoricarpi CBS 119687]KAF2129854.1 hypothetical protein P153DRAFT_430952 [Dothidotthia symphoricarpi CBS 119687]
MCGCTLYDSPTCGHSWLSMSQPCGFLSDLLNCPYRQTYQTLVAPAMTCPMCNGGFADRETMEMVQGPWGCNQMIRNAVGGSYAVPGQWGNAPLGTSNWGNQNSTALVQNSRGNQNNTALVQNGWGSQAMVPGNGSRHDHRPTGPYGAAPMVCDGYNGNFVGNDGFGGGGEWEYGGRERRRKHKSSHYREYYRSSKPATNCGVISSQSVDTWDRGQEALLPTPAPQHVKAAHSVRLARRCSAGPHWLPSATHTHLLTSPTTHYDTSYKHPPRHGSVAAPAPPRTMSSFFENLWLSIFTPGPTPTLLVATNASFAALQLLFFTMLIATRSIHFIILSCLCGGLWWSINWFAAEIRAAQAKEEEAQRIREARRGEKGGKGAEGQALDSGDDTEMEGQGQAAQAKKSVRIERPAEARAREETPKPEFGGLSAATAGATGLSQLGDGALKQRRGLGESTGDLSTDSEWEKLGSTPTQPTSSPVTPSHPAMAAPVSVADLVAQAGNYTYNGHIPLAAWLRTASTMQKEAQVYEQEGNDAQMYLLLYRHADLVLQKLQTHPDRNRPENRRALNAATTTVYSDLKKLEAIAPRIKRRHEEYEQRRGRQLDALKTLEGQAGLQELDGEGWKGYESRPALDAQENQSLAARLAQREVHRRDTVRRSGGLWDHVVLPGEEGQDLSSQLQEVARLQQNGHRTSYSSRPSSQSTTPYNYPSVPHKSAQERWQIRRPIPPPPVRERNADAMRADDPVQWVGCGLEVS